MKYLFIGGPKDRKMVDVPDDRYIVYCPQLHDYANAGPHIYEDVFDEHTYRQCRLHHGHQYQTYYLHDSLKEENVIQILMDDYASK